MAKKITIALAVIIFSFCCGICFAEENNSNINLGNEITNALDDTKSGVRDVANDVMDGTVKDGTSIKNKYYNKTTSNSYSAYRTSDDVATTTANTAMDTTTWIWIILALAAIIIVAMIWYYAVQNTDNRD